MNWRSKAVIMRVCAGVPLGDRLYPSLQRRFGRLTADPMSRIPAAARMASWLADEGCLLAESTLLEVGTGHKSIVLIGLSFLGPEQVVSFDLHRRLDTPLLRQSLAWIVREHVAIHARFDALTDPVSLDARLDLLARHSDHALAAVVAAGIECRAPADAARTGLPPTKVDVHCSVTVLEHIPLPTIAEIMSEAARVIRRGGRAIHLVDPSDHFAHQHASISRANFLRFEEHESQGLAGNAFAYCYRARASQLVATMTQAGVRAGRRENTFDERGTQELAAGFPLATPFPDLPRADLCTTNVDVLLRPGGPPASASPWAP